MKDLKTLTKKGHKALKRYFTYGCAAVAMLPVMALPASAVTIKENVDTGQVIGGILDVIFKIALYVGIVITVIGVFSFILAFKDDNAEQQSRGIRLAVVGAALMGLKVLVGLTGLI